MDLESRDSNYQDDPLLKKRAPRKEFRSDCRDTIHNHRLYYYFTFSHDAVTCLQNRDYLNRGHVSEHLPPRPSYFYTRAIQPAGKRTVEGGGLPLSQTIIESQTPCKRQIDARQSHGRHARTMLSLTLSMTDYVLHSAYNDFSTLLQKEGK